MNCQDITELLDDRDIGALGASVRRQAELHLSSCRQCASEWEAHERMLAVSVPPIPDRVARVCGGLLAEAAEGGRRRPRARPAFIGVFLLVGAAAAAVLSIEWGGDSLDIPVVRTDDAGVDTTSTGTEALVDAAADGSADVPAASAAASRSASRGGGNASTSAGFTVAVPPLVKRTADPDAVAVGESIYSALLDELRTVPNLVLVELDGPVDDAAPGSVFGAVSLSRAFVTGAPSTPPQNVSVQSGGVNVGGADAIATSGTLSVKSLNVYSDAPAAFSLQAEGVSTASVQAQAGSEPALVNVIMRTAPADGDVAAAAAHADFESGANADEPAYDFLLNVRINEGGRTPSALPAFTFSVVGSKTGNPDQRVMMAMTASPYDPVDAREFARQTVEQLRKTLFDPDDRLVEELQAAVLDQTATVDERLKALSELQVIANRSGLDGRAGPVVAAVIEMAERAATPERRAQIWRLMRGSTDPALARPLVDALLYDSTAFVRLEAASRLEAFAEDPTVHAALEQAGGFDASPEVRKQAKWSSLSNAGRRDYVTSSLLDTSLSDEDRVAPLLYGTQQPTDQPFGRPRTEPVIDGDAATALIGIIERAPTPKLDAVLIPHLSGVDQPDVIAFLVDSLKNGPSDLIRGISAESLRIRAGDATVRAALENARTADPSPAVRDVATSVLDGPAIVQ